MVSGVREETEGCAMRRQSMAAAGDEGLGDVPRERPAAAAMEEGGTLLVALNTRMAM